MSQSFKEFEYTEEKSSYLDHKAFRVMSGNGSCQVNIFGPRIASGYEVKFDCSMTELPDREIGLLMRGASSIALLEAARSAIESVVDGSYDFLNLVSLAFIAEDVRPEYDYLKKIVLPESDERLVDLVAGYEAILKGEHPLSGHVYCLSDQLGHFKIGFSGKLDSRIKQLSTQPPFDLQLIHAHLVYDMRSYESAFHKLFAAKRLKGEWFALSADDIDSFVYESWLSAYLRKFGGEGDYVG